MSRELLNVNNTDTIKQSDDSTTIILSAHDDNEPKIFKPGDIGTIHISTSQYHIPSIPAKLVVGSNNVNINSADLVDLPAGKYSLELWVSQQNGPKMTIYPSSGSLALTIDKNADDLTDKTLTTLTLDDLRKDLHADVNEAVKHIKVDPSMLDLSDYAKKADVPAVTLDVDNRTLTINKQTINIPDSVDLSGYAKTADVPNVKYNKDTKTLTVNGVTVEIPSNVDLSDYYTKEQVEQQIKNNKTTVDLTDYVKREDLSDLAKKTDVPAVRLDTAKRTLTINGTAINIPDNVDLSGYAKTAEVPSVKYDAQTKTLTVNGVTVEIPSNVDLSNYYTKDQVEQQIKNNKVTVDLTDYVKREQLSDYAKKTDVPSVTLDTSKRTLTVNGTVINIPDNVDLSGYATKAELPKVTLDMAKRQITVGDASINVPDNVDLSNYYTKSEVDDKLATASAGGKVDLSGYVKTSQLYDYAKKQDVPSVVYDSNKKQLTINGVNVDLPDNVDLSDYVRKEDTADFAKKSDIPTVPEITLDTAKRTLTVNNNVINIPNSVDLTGYVKTGDLANYALKSDIPAAPDLSQYALKSDIKAVDLTPYLTKVDADSKYATKAEIPDMSGYALKSDIKPVDLTPYVKTVDLTPYVTKTTADATYATKADVAAVEKQPGKDGQNGKDGAPGSNGHSVWMYNASAANLSVSITGLMNYDYDSQLKPQVDDIVIGNDGSVAKITSVSDYGLFSTGEALAQIKAKSSEQKRTPVTWHHQYTTSTVGIDEDAGKPQYSTGLLETRYWNGWQSKLPQNQQVYPLVGDVVVYQDKVIKLITWSDGSGTFKTDDEGDVKAASMTLQ